MTSANPYQTYVNVQFNTADQGTLILTAYDGALRFCRAAISAMETGDKAAKGDWLNRAFETVGELRRTLRPDVGGEVARHLDQAYAFICRQITLANLSGKREYIDNAVLMLDQMRDAWRLVVKQTREEASAIGINA